MLKTITCFGLLAGAFIVRAQAPLCLVGQAAAVNGSAIIDLMIPLANEIDSVGQLHTSIYAMEDSVVREAFMAGKIKKPDRFYKLEDVLAAAKAVNAPYAIWIEGQNSNLKVGKDTQKVLNCHLILFKGGRKIWENTDTQAVSISKDANTEDTIRSVMSSFTSKMEIGPLKGFAKYPKTTVPLEGTVGKGQAPIIPETNDDDPVLNDWIAIQEKVKEAEAAGKGRTAEMLLRDAIDAAPADPLRRKALIEFLERTQQIDAAVDVTISAAEALGDPTLISKAARILLDNNRIEQANEIVKDAIASDPNNPAIQLLQAELRMRAAMPDQALKHLENALKTKPTSEGFLLRAISRALLGAEDGVKLDLDRALKDDPQILNVQYQRIGAILDAAWEVEGPDLRSLLQKATLKRTSEEVAEGVDSQERMAKACLALLGENAANAKFEKSHGLRLLALNLLIQTITELRHYIANGDKASLDEATTDLGETLKTLSEAKEQFSKESTDARNSNPPR